MNTVVYSNLDGDRYWSSLEVPGIKVSRWHVSQTDQQAVAQAVAEQIVRPTYGLEGEHSKAFKRLKQGETMRFLVGVQEDVSSLDVYVNTAFVIEVGPGTPVPPPAPKPVARVA